MQIEPKCDMLIDQDKYIGGDPIGHCCFNSASYSDGEYYICDDCLENLKKKEGRVTFPVHGSVKTFPLMVEAFLKGWTK